jgi:hypothetical protein
MQPRTRRILSRIAASVLALALATALFVWFLGMPLLARYMARRAPVLTQTPAPVRDSTVSTSPGKNVAFCGTEFELPWSDLDNSKTKSGINTMTFHFESGLLTLISCEPPREFVDGVLSSTKTSADKLRLAYGNEAAESDYALTRLMLETTPSAITARNSHSRGGTILAMLVLKAIATPPSSSGMFSIHTPEFDGFQYEDPQAKPNRVIMVLFAPDRGLEFQFFLKYKGASPHIAQADINRIIKTLHTVGPYLPPKQASLQNPN